MEKLEDYQVFFKNFRFLVDNQELNREELSKNLGISTNTIRSFYNSNNIPKLLFLNYISNYFNVSVEDLLNKNLTIDLHKSAEFKILKLFKNHKKDLTEEQLKTLEQIILLLIRKEEISITWSKKI